MSNFNTKRFIQTFKWSMLATKKEMTTIAGCMFFLYLMPFIISVMSSHGKPDIIVEHNIHGATITCISFFTFYIMISGCWILNNMKTKEQRITFKMLPASDLEKYLSRVIYITVVWFAIGILTYFLADICRILMDLMSDSFGIDCTTPQALNLIDYHTNLTAGNIGYYLSMASIYTGIFWGLSLCIIGGVLLCHR